MDSTAIISLLETGHELSKLRTNALNDETKDLVALPQDYKLHDLEQYRMGRRRFRGRFSTSALADYVAYVKNHAKDTEAAEKPEGFIDPLEPEARVIFNLHSEDAAAGHADWVADLKLEKTAAYKALLAIEGKALTQRQLVDWIEDWQDNAVAYGPTGELIRLAVATTAIGKLDIKSSKQSGHTDGNFQQARSTFEQVEANLADTMPRSFGFGCHPYHGLREREFKLGLSILTSHDEPKLVLRIKQREAVQEDVILEFKTKLTEDLGETAQLTIGHFKP